MSRAPGPRLTALLALKVWRDTRALGGTSLSLMALVAVGVSLYVLFAQARTNLESSIDRFYAEEHFGQATILVQSAPASLVDAVRQLPGVEVAIGRRVKDGVITLRDRPRSRVMGRFVGVPAGGREPINSYRIVRGRDVNGRGEAVLEQKFAAANRLRPGDLITGGYLGVRHDFVVVGLATSPEYLYPTPDKESPMVAPDSFGVCWIEDDALRAWLGLGQVITEVHVLCAPEQAENILRAMRALGERYGLRSWWTRLDQPSARLLAMDLKGWRTMCLAFPVLFMFAAALSLYSSLSRVIRLQTGVIGFLRASGLGQREVLWHYLAQGVLVSSLGALPGVIGGHLASIWLLGLYQGVIRVPDMITRPHPLVMVEAAAMAVTVGMVAAWVPARRAAGTPPAVAMRGDDAASTIADGGGPTRRGWLERLIGRLPVLLRIPARGVLRRPGRTVVAVGGLASGCAILLMVLGMYVSIMGSIAEFTEAMVNYELDVTLSGPQTLELANAIGRADGVTALQRTVGLPVRVRAWGNEVSMLASGLQPGQTTMRLRDMQGRVISVRPGELWLARHIADKLEVQPGDLLEVEWAYSGRQVEVKTVLRFAGPMDLTFGGYAVGEYHDIRRRLAEQAYGSALYGVHIACPPAVGRELQRRLERDDQVVNVMSMGDLRRQILDSLELTRTFVLIMLGFGALLAGAVLHGISSVGILERLRELATLRSLGFSARATTAIAALEVYLLATVGLLVGSPLGNAMNRAFLKSFESDTMSMRAFLPPWTYAVAAAIVLGLVGWSLRAGVRRLATMDLAQATKARE